MNARGDENRSVRHTKRQIYEAMVELLKRKDVRSITVRELTELADINRSTFYLHYRDVYDLLEQMECHAIDELKQFLTSNDLTAFRQDMPTMIREIFTHLYQNRDRFLVLFGPNGRKGARQQAMDSGVDFLVQQFQEELPDQHLPLGIRFILEGGVGVLETYYFEQDPAGMEELICFFTNITNIIFRGYALM